MGCQVRSHRELCELVEELLDVLGVLAVFIRSRVMEDQVPQNPIARQKVVSRVVVVGVVVVGLVVAGVGRWRAWIDLQDERRGLLQGLVVAQTGPCLVPSVPQAQLRVAEISELRDLLQLAFDVADVPVIRLASVVEDEGFNSKKGRRRRPFASEAWNLGEFHDGLVHHSDDELIALGLRVWEAVARRRWWRDVVDVEGVLVRHP